MPPILIHVSEIPDWKNSNFLHLIPTLYAFWQTFILFETYVFLNLLKKSCEKYTVLYTEHFLKLQMFLMKTMETYFMKKNNLFKSQLNLTNCIVYDFYVLFAFPDFYL